MKKYAVLLLFALILTVSGAGRAALVIPFGENVPHLDGKLDDPCWKNLKFQGPFLKLGTRKKADLQTRFKVFHDNKNLYLALELNEPDAQSLKRPVCSHDSGLIWQNNAVEIGFTHDPACLVFYKCIIDCNGSICDLLARDDNTNSSRFKLDLDWSSHAKAVTSKRNGKWFLEVAIPFGSMDFQPDKKKEWRLYIGRSRLNGKKRLSELSAFSYVPEVSHMLPAYFTRVKLDEFDPGVYYLALEDVKYTLGAEKKSSLRLTAEATIRNHSDSFRLFRCRISQSPSGKRGFAEKLNALHPQKYQRFSVTLPHAAQGKRMLRFELYSNNSKPFLLKQFYQEADFRYQPVKIHLKRPSYRNNIYASMPDKTIEAVVELKENTDSPLLVTLSGPGYRREHKIAKGKPFNRVLFNGAELPDGTYTLSCRAGADGKKQLKDSLTLRKLPYRKGEIFLDENGVTYVDGRKFFPLGWYGSYDGKPTPLVNSAVTLAKFRTAQQARESIKQHKKQGLYLLLSPFQDLHKVPGKTPSLFTIAAMRRTLSAEQKRKIRAFVTEVGKEDGLLGYYMADEPEGQELNPRFFEEVRDYIAHLDPYHPCILLNYSVQGIRKYYKGADILMPDCYPQYFHDGSTNLPRYCSSEWAKTSTSLRSGAWQMPLGTLWPAGTPQRKGVPADFDEQRSEVFQALIHNVKGFLWYAWYFSQKYSEFIIGPFVNSETIMLLREYLFQNSVPEGISTRTALTHFQAGVKKYRKNLCVIAVNTSVHKGRVTFTLKDNRWNGRLFVAGENRSVAVKDGRFTDSFAPKETHIYLTDPKLARAVPSVQGTRDRIRDHLAARKRKGNLVGIGQMLDVDINAYSRGRVPAGIPRIKASSDWTHYVTGGSHAMTPKGSLYFLFDGLRNPPRFEYSWAPLARDKKPWIEITLPEKSIVRELKLCTPNGNLTSCRVTLDSGRSVTADGNRSEIFSIPLPGEKTSRIRIDFLKYGYSRGNIGKRLLTEIEVY